MSARVLVVRAPGTNCDEETVHAWQLAGATADLLHVGRVLERPACLDGYAVLTIPGGFSYGDDLGAGRILAIRLAGLGDALRRFHDRGGLILGICNGFQVLVKAGLLPGGTEAGPATLAHNASGRFEARWVRLAVEPGVTPFLDEPGPIELPVAHGEGRFLTADPAAADRLVAAGRSPLRYVDDQGRPTPDYPANPNGSLGAVAGLCDPTGRIFGLMPHPERFVDPLHHPRAGRGPLRAEGDGLRIFRGALRAVGAAV